MRALTAMAAMAAMVIVYVALTQALTSPELTARYTARQQAQLQAEQARQQAQMVQAREQGETARAWAQTWETWGVYGTGAAGVAVVAIVGGWEVVEWQRQRTKRHEVTEVNVTQRHMITAKKDIVLAYLAVCGDPDAMQGRLNGIDGVFLPASNEFVPLDVCRAELAANQGTALARRTPQTINVPPARQKRRFLIVGEMEQEDW